MGKRKEAQRRLFTITMKTRVIPLSVDILLRLELVLLLVLYYGLGRFNLELFK